MVYGEPAVLTDIMDTIASLKESKGSPPDKILDHMVALQKAPIRNASFRIKKALKAGLKTGLLKETGGKFKLGLAPKDYAVFKSFRLLEKRPGSLGLPVIEHRRRRGRRSRSRRRRRRGRRRDTYFNLGLDEEDSAADDDDYGSFKSFKKLSKTKSLPIKEIRRRRGRSRRRKGRRRRGRRRGDFYDVENLAGTDESGAEPMDRGRRRRGRSRRRRGKRRRGRRRGFGLDDEIESARSSESKDISSKSSEEKPKTAKGGKGRGDLGPVRAEPEKREIVTADPPRSRVDHQENMRSSHCIHDHGYHHEGPYSHHPPPPHSSHYPPEHYYEE